MRVHSCGAYCPYYKTYIGNNDYYDLSDSLDDILAALRWRSMAYQAETKEGFQKVLHRIFCHRNHDGIFGRRLVYGTSCMADRL